MMTVLCDWEQLLNLRPLTYISEDPDELIALTPMMCLNEAKSKSVVLFGKNSNIDKRFEMNYANDLRKLLECLLVFLNSVHLLQSFIVTWPHLHISPSQTQIKLKSFFKHCNLSWNWNFVRPPISWWHFSKIYLYNKLQGLIIMQITLIWIRNYKF